MIKDRRLNMRTGIEQRGEDSCARPANWAADEHPYALTPLQSAMVAGELSPDQWQRDLVQIRCELDESIDEAILRECFAQLVVRHESLRVKLDWNEGEGRPSVAASATVPLAVVDLTEGRGAALDARLKELRAASWQDSLHVLDPPRLRALLLRFAPDRHELTITYHETVLDEHAGKLLAKELFELYDDAVARREAKLAPAVPFHDYLRWLSDNRDEEACHFWGDLLRKAPPPSPPPLLGTGTCDVTTETCCGEMNRLLTEQSTARLKQWVQRKGANLNTALLAAWSVVVATHSHDEDARFSAVFSLREPDYANADSAVAMCFSVLPFVVRGVRRPSDELLRTVLEEERAARKYSAYLDGSAATRRLIGHASAQSIVFFDELDVDDYIRRAHPEWTHRRFALFGRNSYAMEIRGFGGKRMRIEAWYNPRVYDRRSVDCLLDQLVRVLEQLPEGGGELIETESRIEKWEVGPTRQFAAKPLHQLVTEQAKRTPTAIALIGSDRTVTYEQLEGGSNRLARRLMSGGLAAGTTAAVMMARTPEAIVALLAIMKAGAAYVPIEASWPAERVATVLRQLKTGVIVTDASRAELANAAAKTLDATLTIVRADDEEAANFSADPVPDASTPDSLAYIIFTSGSTGLPKGVVVQHRSVCNLIDWARREFHFDARDRVLWVTSLGFDLSVFDIFGMLAYGGSIRIASDDEVASPQRLLAILTHEPITFWDSAPQALERLRGFLDADQFCADVDTTRLRLVFLSGDWIPLALPDAVRRLFIDAEIISLGGATEATVWSNSHRVGRIESSWRSIPYGRPIQNARYYILDERQRRCAIGVSGELYIGGEVLAHSYAVDPEQTSQRFVRDPFVRRPDARMYRTGDMARWWPDGNIELLGRLDDQVKVRGYRVELSEIDHALQAHATVRDAVTVARRNDLGQNQLAAYIVAHDHEEISYSGLRSHLRQSLPEYMIPSMFVQLPALPLTSSGKLDRRALSEPQECVVLRDRAYRAPAAGTEVALARIFTQVLKCDRVGADDNFFELGGDSLSALAGIFAAEQAGLALTIDALRTKSLAELAAEAIHVASQAAQATAMTEPIPLVPSQQWLLERKLARPASYAFCAWLRACERLDIEAIDRAWQAVNDHHEMMRIRFEESSSDLRQVVSPRIDARVRQVDLAHRAPAQAMAEAQHEARALAQSAQLLDATLPQLMCFRMPGGEDLLFVFIPHLITDEYSAKIAIEDLGAAYVAHRSGHAPTLPQPTTPFSAWARHLRACAAQDELAAEGEMFCALPWNEARPFPRDLDVGDNTYANARDIHVSLSAPDSDKLLEFARLSALPLQSILVAALSSVLGEWSQSVFVPIDITAAGRERIFQGPPTHRSTGYFSVIYPALVRAHQHLGSGSIREVHSALQSAPARGVLYGLLRYSSENSELRSRVASVPAAQIKFNYYGLQPLCSGSCAFQPAGIPAPPMLQPSDRRAYLLNLEIDYHERCLQMAWKYSASSHRPETVEMLAENYLVRLRAVSRMHS